MLGMRARWPVILGGLGALAFAGALALPGIGVVPRVRQEQQRIEQQGRAMLQGSVPAGTLDGTRVELRPTGHGWLVLFRGADVACAQTSWRDRCGAAFLPGQQPVVFHDLFACVDYRRGAGYMAGGLIRSSGTLGCPEPPP